MEIIPRLTSMTTLYLLSYLKALSDGVELTWLPTLIFYLRKEKYQGKFCLTEFELLTYRREHWDTQRNCILYDLKLELFFLHLIALSIDDLSCK